MDVGLRDRHDPQAVLAGEIQVAIHVPFGIEDDRLAGPLTPDQVGRLGETFVVFEPEEHVGSLS